VNIADTRPQAVSARNLTVSRWWLICVVAGLLLAYSHRNDMDQDGLSYVEIAAQTAAGHPGALINRYWSPGYPALLSAAFFIVRPLPETEFPLVHAVNFLMLIAVLAGFRLFAGASLEGVENPQIRGALFGFAGFLFLWILVEYVGVGLCTPDLSLAGAFLFTAFFVARIASEPAQIWNYVALGTILAAAYYIKAAAFPLACALFILLLWAPPSRAVQRKWILFAAIVFGILCAPLIALVSRRTGHLTIGETARLNYAWYVAGTTPVWRAAWVHAAIDHTGGPHVLLENPAVIEFAKPLEVTYAIWFDPAYWSPKSTARFDFARQIAATQAALREDYGILLEMSPLVGGAVALWLARKLGARWPVPKPTPDLWWMLFWPVSTAAMYAGVHSERRFLVAALLIGWVAIYRFLIAGVSEALPVRVVLVTVCAALSIPLAAHLGGAAANGAISTVRPRPTTDQALADLLLKEGLRQGDFLAYAGEGFDVYFARLARMRVTAQLPSAAEFWSLNDEGMVELERRLASAGVKAIVSKHIPVDTKAAKWKTIVQPGPPGTGIFLIQDLERALGS